MRQSVKWLGVIVSVALLTTVIFASLSRIINIDFPLSTSNSNAPISFSKTSTIAIDQSENMVSKIDWDFLDVAKPPRPNYKGKPPPPCWPPPTPHKYWSNDAGMMAGWSDDEDMFVETPDIPSVNIPKPNFEVSKNIDIYTIADRYSGSCGDAMPLSVRITPVFPTNATKSGHCNIEFQLDAKGNYINVKAVSCSEEIFAAPSIRAVQRWRINICDPEQETDTELVRETSITFRLTDESGKIIPE